jgi:hypothetical protein
MSYELLDRIRRCNLPVELSGEDADMVRAYAAAGLVTAEFIGPAYSRQTIAKVLNLTSLGRKTVEARVVQKSLTKFTTRK